MSADRMLALATAINNALSLKIPATFPAMTMRDLGELQKICVNLRSTGR
ncbi:hypothetical protein [Shewanella glacialipiscicola]|jgi:hypothetical protein